MTDDLWDIVERGETDRLAEAIAGQRSASESVRSDDTLLHVAWQSNRPLIPWLVAQGISPNQRDTIGGTVLMYAAANDVIETVAVLISRGADVNAKNDSGETAFSYTCANDSFQSAKLLHAAGAEVNTADAGGGSLLDWALNWASPEFYKWLVAIGCKHMDGSPR